MNCCNQPERIVSDVKVKIWGCSWFGQFESHKLSVCISCDHVFYDTRYMEISDAYTEALQAVDNYLESLRELARELELLHASFKRLQ